MKYLIVEDFAGQPVCFLFPRRVAHEDMREQLPYGQVLAAGFVTLEHGVPHCSGGSAALGVKARAQDSAMIAEALHEHPVS